MRKKTRQIRVGRIRIGGGAPVSIQSMAKTDTKDVTATVKQIRRLEALGCEVIRVAVKDTNSASAIKKIKQKISIPLEADIHFDHRLALLAMESGADCIRLNPGNIFRPAHIREVIRTAEKKRIPIRIGVNSGSLPRSVPNMVRLTLDYLKIFEKEKFYDIMISLKASDVIATIEAYRKMAKLRNYPLHLGVTATGVGSQGIIKSAIGIGTLLAEGIGDTIRVSLTGPPEEEVLVAKYILQTLGLRCFGPEIISCPTCGRCQVDLVTIARRIKDAVGNTKCAIAKRPLSIAVMGCEVNGPGEAKEADIGIAFGKGSGIVFKKGKVLKKVKVKDSVRELIGQIKRACP